MHLPRLNLLLAVGLIALALADFDDDDSCAGPECAGEPLPAKGNSILQAKTREGSKSTSEVYEDDDVEQVPVRSKNVQKRKSAKTPAKPAVAKSLIQTGSSSPTVVQGKDMAEEGGVSKGDMMKILRAIKAAEESGKLAELEPELRGSNKPSAFKKALAVMMGKQEGAPEEEKVFLAQLGERAEQAQERLVKEAEGSTQLLPLEAQKQIALMLREKSHLKLERGRRNSEGLELERGLQGSEGRRRRRIEKELKKIPQTSQTPPEVPSGEYERPVREGPGEIDEEQMKKTLTRVRKLYKDTWSDEEYAAWKKKMKKIGKATKSEEELQAFRDAVSEQTEKRMTRTQKAKGVERVQKDKKLMPPELMFRQLKRGTLQTELLSQVQELKDKLKAKRKEKRSKWAKKVKDKMKTLKKRAKWLEKLLDRTEDKTVEDELDD
mmetsp:Transcript_96738/g.282815  ORF Transcript_96738/g.282815 Transcript_96738/m.282815 type:complete len:436 (-) Transcript_96738:91-1398(-)